jgi:hypothetical protein
VLNFEKPVTEIIWEHRDDYVGVLEYCDSICEDLKDAMLPEDEKLAQCEEPFAHFFITAFLSAYRQHNDSMRRRLVNLGIPVDDLPPPPQQIYDLRPRPAPRSLPLWGWRNLYNSPIERRSQSWQKSTGRSVSGTWSC